MSGGEKPQVPRGWGEVDLHLFREGTHTRLYEKLGARSTPVGGKPATTFAVWAPNARAASVIGDFNEWKPDAHPMEKAGDSGVWFVTVEGCTPGVRYRYRLSPPNGGPPIEKSDPYADHGEVAPSTASIVWGLDYEWGDREWMESRAEKNSNSAPISIYEVHLGSWMRVPEEGFRSLSYREIAPKLAEYVRRLGFSHVELLPVMEHPFFGSWGYQVTGYFAPTSRYGTPQDFMFLVDTLHQAGIGVILDWVPAHFPRDPHGLAEFDGTHLYEHADPRRGEHPEWGTKIFNYARNEVKNFLTSSAVCWLDRYHADGLRVDGVSSMLYLDYGKQPGAWVPNQYGGRENLEAADFLRHLNETVRRDHPGTLTIAEESTAWPLVTGSASVGGLSFDRKWDMGWMHDTLRYLEREPIHRRYHHNELTFRGMYAYSERYVLSLSHDEVVYGKGSLIGRMPGDDWQKHANLRLLFSYMFAMPGKPLLFMGGEFAQYAEWNHDGSLDWHLADHPFGRGHQRLFQQLHRIQREHPALHRLDDDPRGFEWIDANDSERSILSFIRLGEPSDAPIVAAFNFTPQPRHNLRLGVPRDGRYAELINTDAKEFSGSGQGNLGGVTSAPIPSHSKPFSVNITLPPLGAVFLSHQPT